MSDETEKVYRELEEIIGVCWELKNNKKGRNLNQEVLPFYFLYSHFTLIESWQIHRKEL